SSSSRVSKLLRGAEPAQTLLDSPEQLRDEDRDDRDRTQEAQQEDAHLADPYRGLRQFLREYGARKPPADEEAREHGADRQEDVRRYVVRRIEPRLLLEAGKEAERPETRQEVEREHRGDSHNPRGGGGEQRGPNAPQRSLVLEVRDHWLE